MPFRLSGIGFETDAAKVLDAPVGESATFGA
jgi:hypothetical protein